MFEVVNKLILTEGIKRLDIRAPRVAKNVKAGQFVSVCCEEGDERVPLTVVDCDRAKGIISLIFHEAGATTKKLGALPINESLFSILGPLGNPATIERKGEVVCIATGIASAQILPIARALRQAGNKVIGVIGAKTKKKLMLEAQMRVACEKIFITTEDGSYERRGLATDVLRQLLQTRDIQLVYAIGSAEMMEAVCEMTKKKKIKTLVQLNPMMVDCMGMCGSCRVRIGGKTVLVCTDGPEFNGHQVDFKDYKIRLNAFEGHNQWQGQKLQQLSQRNESVTFRRFLSGILKE
ncbi:MAG TPA: sulfide/dihydroorotate dehydrogenase-like FAD/NAD-binding protein [Candidatus Omnitrophota bacterium]|nr:sulfide/dihydroorotate dehydrogenase-like FAD/NAD-binding protein [Candidatus Omnitrophota bacterium]